MSSMTRCYGASRLCPTCKAHGSSSSCARIRAATTCCECFRPPRRRRTRSRTTAPSCSASSTCLVTRTSPVTRASSQPGVRSSPCGSGSRAQIASCTPVIGARHPGTLPRMIAGLANPAGSLATPSMRAAAHAEEVLRTAGFAAPPWAALADELSASQPRYFGDNARSWQQAACAHLDRKALETLFTELDPASRALLAVALPLPRCRLAKKNVQASGRHVSMCPAPSPSRPTR